MTKTVHRSLLTGVILCFVGVNVRWLWLYRHGQPLDIDEAGYLGFSLIDYYGLVNGGILGWIRAIEAPNPHAPLTPALSSLIYCVFGPHVIVGFLVPLLAGAMVIAVTYFLGKSLGSCRIGLIGGFLVASCPIVVVWSRSYSFALPATAVTTMSLLALLRSDRFANVRWSSVFGVCLGLMPLARTMTIAFVPGIVLGAAVYASVSPTDRRRLLVLTWSLFLAVITASTWLVPNRAYVFPYLFGFGYGARAAEYGKQLSFFGLEKWIFMVRLFSDYVYLPHFLVIFTGALALVFTAARHFVQNGVRVFSRTAMTSPVLPILISVAGAVAALASSRNRGTAFIAPIIPAVIVLAVWSLHKLYVSKLYGSLLTIAMIIVAFVASVPMIDLAPSISRRRDVAVPVLGLTIVTDGRGYIQLYESAGGFKSENPVEPIDSVFGRAWVALNGTTAAKIEQLKGVNTVAAFGFRHYLLNLNTVNLQLLLSVKHQIGIRQVVPIVTEDSVSGYREWLTSGEASDVSLLLLTDGHLGEILPAVNLEHMRNAAQQSGFVFTDQWPMPDGQNVSVWKRTSRSATGSEAPPLK